MSGPPDPSTLSSLKSLAFASLGITIFALLHARSGKAFFTPFIHGYQVICQLLWASTLSGIWSTAISKSVQKGKYYAFNDVIFPVLRLLMNTLRPKPKQASQRTIGPIIYEDHLKLKQQQRKEGAIMNFSARTATESEIKRWNHEPYYDGLESLHSSQKTDSKRRASFTPNLRNRSRESDLETGQS